MPQQNLHLPRMNHPPSNPSVLGLEKMLQLRTQGIFSTIGGLQSDLADICRVVDGPQNLLPPQAGHPTSLHILLRNGIRPKNPDSGLVGVE